MSEHISLSVIVPVYNAENYLPSCVDILLNQDFKEKYEIIMVDDCSTDNSNKIIVEKKTNLIKLITLSNNVGPASARNEGIKTAKGKYIFFLDADDKISKDTFKVMFEKSKNQDFDIVLSDKKVIENSKNQRENNFYYNKDMIFENNNINLEIKKRLYDPSYYGGLIGITGRLIKRSMLIKNNLFFQNGLRYLEDEIFSWDILSYCKKIKYIKRQLYSYYTHPNKKTAISEAFINGYPIQNFKIAKKHVLKCFKLRGESSETSEALANQAFIYFIIGSLISFSRSIILKKVDTDTAKLIKKKMISDILKDKEVELAIKDYRCQKDENKWIPFAIKWRLKVLLNFMCFNRAKQIIKMRKNKF